MPIKWSLSPSPSSPWTTHGQHMDPWRVNLCSHDANFQHNLCHLIALFTFPFFESFLCLNLRLWRYNFCHLVGFFTLDIWNFWGVLITLTIDWTLWHFKATKAAQISIEPHNCLIRKRWSFKMIKCIFVWQQISQEIWIIFGLTGNTYMTRCQLN